MNIEIANRLVNLRKSNYLSQEALAEKLGISRQAVSKWERAEASPDTDNLIQLAKLYHVSLDELLMLHEEEPAARNEGEDALVGGSEGEDVPAGGSGRRDTLAGGSEEEDVQTGGSGRENTPAGGNGKEDVPAGRNDRKDMWMGGESDEDIMPEKGMNEEKERKERENEEEYVDVGLEGVHIKDRDGSEVHIGWNGIHVDDKEKGDNVHIDRKGVYVNGKKYDRYSIFFRNFPFAALICILYVIIGTLFQAWHPGWLLFLLIPLWYSFVSAVKHENANLFAYPVLATLLFLGAGFFWGIWHPGWIIFLTIPLYYALIPYFAGEEDKD